MEPPTAQQLKALEQAAQVAAKQAELLATNKQQATQLLLQMKKHLERNTVVRVEKS